MSSGFKKATRKQAKLRAVYAGPSGAGKTFSALAITRGLVGPSGRIAVVDTENKSASKYVGEPEIGDFDVMEVLKDYNPKRLIDAIAEAEKEGYDAVVVDSITHFWNGPGGMLELVDYEVKRMKANGQKPDSFAAWKAVDPVYMRVLDAIKGCSVHFSGTLRAKTDYEKQTDEKGKTKITKHGMAPQIRDGFEYEFDLEGMINMDHVLTIGKTRCRALDGRFFEKPGQDVADMLLAWLNDGAPVESSQPSVEDFGQSIANATTLLELGQAAARASAALKDGRISRAQYDTHGSQYQLRMKELSAPKEGA